MSVYTLLLILIYGVGLSFGQLLFKISAQRFSINGYSLTYLFLDLYFISAIILYGLLTLIWTYILTKVQLSKAYPFMIIPFLVTPFLASTILGERISQQYIFGVFIICTGLLVISNA